LVQKRVDNFNFAPLLHASKFQVIDLESLTA
jgi:hypothetical protein